MTERMQFLWAERWPIALWLAYALLMQAKGTIIWTLIFTLVVLISKLDKLNSYAWAMAITLCVYPFVV